MGAVPALALPPPRSRAVSGELRFRVKRLAWGCWSLRRGRLSPHAERRTRGLGDLEHESAWRDNRKVRGTLGL